MKAKIVILGLNYKFMLYMSQIEIPTLKKPKQTTIHGIIPTSFSLQAPSQYDNENQAASQ